jgi:hypothetical protein
MHHVPHSPEHEEATGIYLVSFRACCDQDSGRPEINILQSPVMQNPASYVHYPDSLAAMDQITYPVCTKQYSHLLTRLSGEIAIMKKFINRSTTVPCIAIVEKVRYCLLSEPGKN